MAQMKIFPDPTAGGHRTGTLTGITKKEIDLTLGFTPNVDDDSEKVKYSWGFVVDDHQCGVWDYYGSWREKEFSTYGPHATLTAVFGTHYKPHP